MDLFFDLFVPQAERRLGEYLRVERERETPPLYVPQREVESRNSSLKAAGVDGGVGVVRLSNGHQVVIARAAAVGPDFMERDLVADVATIDGSLHWAYLVITESLAGLKAVGRHGVDVLFMDGSLYAKIMRLVHNLILAREFQNLYYIPEFALALHTLSRLIEEAATRGVRLVFVSKDHNFRLVKEHLIFDRLYAKHRDALFQRGLLWHSVLWIRRFRKELLESYRRAQRYDYEAARLLALLINQSITDSLLLDALLPPGRYTVPMLVGSCDAYINYKDLTTVEKLAKAAEDRLEDSLIFRLREDFNYDVAGLVRNALEKLPKIYFFYIKLRHEDKPLLAEVPAEGRMFDGAPVKAFHPAADVGDVAGFLASHYKDPIHYNTWLWYAHTHASFRSSQLAEYAVYLKKIIAERGANLGVARRVKLAWGL
ncbi:MAG: DNA double-strand break repair nuclease NurA [Pyrobaculum sp.]